MSVCVCVYDYSWTTGYEAAYERYQQIQYYKGRKYNVAILPSISGAHAHYAYNRTPHIACVELRTLVPFITTVEMYTGVCIIWKFVKRYYIYM